MALSGNDKKILAVCLIVLLVILAAVFVYYSTLPKAKQKRLDNPPTRGGPEVCTMPAGMSCTKASLSSTSDKLDITIVNGLQKTIVITNMSCTKKSSQYEGQAASEMYLGQSKSFSLSCNDESGKPIDFDQEDYFNGKINIQYYFKDEGPSAYRRLSGNINVMAD